MNTNLYKQGSVGNGYSDTELLTRIPARNDELSTDTNLYKEGSVRNGYSKAEINLPASQREMMNFLLTLTCVRRNPSGMVILMKNLGLVRDDELSIDTQEYKEWSIQNGYSDKEFTPSTRWWTLYWHSPVQGGDRQQWLFWYRTSAPRPSVRWTTLFWHSPV